jgi:hypothetical protein
MIILGRNMELLRERTRNGKPFKKFWEAPWEGAVEGSFKPISLEDTETPEPPVNLKDPYNVEGTYLRVSYVCLWLKGY